MTDLRVAVRLLETMSRSRPELWPIRHWSWWPHVSAELNPQPLPPHAQTTLAVHETVEGIAHALATAALTGHDPMGVAREIADDWCPTPRPKPKPKDPRFVLPWPRWWGRPHLPPLPPPPEPPIDPRSHAGQELVAAILAEAAVTLQLRASSIADEAVSGALGHIAERVAESALATGG
jgi:hypothetical protein